MQSKKLDKIIFAWDPAAFKGRGYWFVYNEKTGTLGRAASKEESARLGKETGKEPRSPKVYEMSYQRADVLKKTGLLELISRKKFEEGQGLGASIKGAVSEKIRGRLTRIKRSFDPLTLINALTGKGVIGRSIFTAIGRGLGRSDRDIGYFGGYTRTRGYDRNRKAEPMTVHNASGKVTPIAKGDGPADGIAKLYSLFKEDYEQKIKKSELQKDFEEQKNEKIQKRHEEIIKALKSIGATTDGKPQEKNKGGLFDFIMNLWGKFKDMLQPILDIWDDVKSFFKNDLWKNLLKYGKYLVEFLTSPASLILAAIAGSALIGAFIGEKIRDWLEGKQEATAKEQGGEKAVSALKGEREANQASLGLSGMDDENFDAAKTKYDTAVKEKQEIVGRYLVDKGYKRYEKTILGKPQGKYTFEDAQGNPPPDKLLQEASAYADKQLSASKILETPPPAVPKATPLPSTDAGAGRGIQGGPTAEQSSSAPSIPTATPSTATPAPSVTPTGGQMVAATNENMEAQQDTGGAGGGTMVINKTNTSAMGGKSESGSIGEIAVRNDEDSFLRTIKGSLRMV